MNYINLYNQYSNGGGELRSLKIPPFVFHMNYINLYNQYSNKRRGYGGTTFPPNISAIIIISNNV